jgi:hypothetical protein
MKFIFAIFISILVTRLVTAQTEPTPTSFIDEAKKNISDVAESVNSNLVSSTLNRHFIKHGITLQYSPIDLIIPSKTGISYYYSSFDTSKQYEVQYLRGKIALNGVIDDLASTTDERFSFLIRNLPRNSNFNWFYGFSYLALEAELGSRFLSTISNTNIPDADIFKVSSIGIDIGLGHRWYFNNGFTLGADWIGVSQPVIQIKKEAHYQEASTNQQNKDDAEKILNLLSIYPRIYALKLMLGYSF